MDYTDLLSQVEDFARTFFISHPDDRYTYHNLRHTEQVVDAATEIANHFQLDDEEFFIVVSAAWFHDLGYFVKRESHEQAGADMLRRFLADKGVAQTLADKAAGCVLATRLPQQPANLLERIICDADLYHLGTDDFRKTNKALRREKSLLQGTKISGQQWRYSTIELLQSHHYWTDYCRMMLDEGKRGNLKRLREREERAQKEQRKEAASLPAVVKAKPTKARPDRGIETMFRLTSANNQRLSDMADNKAHILVTVNSIILSAVISLLLRKLDSNPHLAIATYMILTVSVLTIIFSILATRPAVNKGTFTTEEINQKKVNLLFFGNFYKMSLEDYTTGMRQVMEDRDFLYGSLIKDVYGQGIAVGRKYRLLRIAYNIFMYGLIVSVIAFIISTFV
jgi:predicted metal-dependent HD superfamily phosphohydrolase